MTSRGKHMVFLCNKNRIHIDAEGTVTLPAKNSNNFLNPSDKPQEIKENLDQNNEEIDESMMPNSMVNVYVPTEKVLILSKDLSLRPSGILTEQPKNRDSEVFTDSDSDEPLAKKVRRYDEQKNAKLLTKSSKSLHSKRKLDQNCEDSDNDMPLAENIRRNDQQQKTESLAEASSSHSSIEYGSSDEYYPNDSPLSEDNVNIDGNKNKRKKIYRWKKSDPKNWKTNINKARRSIGKTYVSKTVQKSPKLPRRIDCQNCRFKCSINFCEEDRKLICSNYWKLSYMRQKDFILSHVKADQPKCRRIRTGTGKEKLSSRKYHFTKGDLKLLQVCKMFFLKTLHISHGPVDNALKGVNEIGIFNAPDKRGHNTPTNKTPDEIIKKVKNHIQGFPTMESHYCRKSSQRQYLDPSLTIAKMYELYVEECSKTNEKYVSEITYRRIFGTNYNLAFYKPKKDQCAVCEKYKNKFISEEDYHQHLKHRDEANAAKSNDKVRAANDKTFLSATFDLQSVLRIPSSQISQMYYAMKLCAYNLTIYEAASPNEAYCYAWSEVNGQRGSCEIGTALLNWIQGFSENVKEISLFSDTCGGQNRNQFIAGLFLYVVQNTHLHAVQHNFMEKGHSYMEVDAMHSAIESAKKNVSIYTMNDLLNIFKLARSKRLKNKRSGPYHVKELTFKDFYDLKALANTIMKNKTKDNTGEQVQWLKIKVMRYEKSQPGRIQFKYNYSDDDYRIIKVFGRGRHTDIPKNLTPLYKGLLPISEKKKKSLLKLVSDQNIPLEYHDWYRSLPVDSKKKNNAPEPTASESDSDIDFA